MNDIRTFIGWEKPAIELICKELFKLSEKNPRQFRQATVVVPTAESGRHLREYMAEQAGRPILMPRICLAGQLIPANANHTASEIQTLCAWLQILGSAMPNQSVSWHLDVAEQMQRVRKQLTQEAKLPEWEENTALRFVKEYFPEEENKWKETLEYEKERWNNLNTLFSGVDATLEQWGYQPAEKSQTAELEHPQKRGLIIIACVPELSPLNRLYLQRLQDTGAAEVQIWVNAPATEAPRFDAFGQPLPHIESGPFARQGWSECGIDIPRLPHTYETAPAVQESDVIHPMGSVQEYGRKVRELAGGLNSSDVVLASCDSALSPALVSAFQPEWPLSMPEGRSLLATEVGRLPMQLRDVCAYMASDSSEIRYSIEDFLALLRNHAWQQCLGSTQNLHAFNVFLKELCTKHLPNSADHVLYMAKRRLEQAEHNEKSTPHHIQSLQHHISFIETSIRFIRNCSEHALFPECMEKLEGLLQRCITSPLLKQGVELLVMLLKEVSALVKDERIACTPQAALELWSHAVQKRAAGILEGATERHEAINLKGWKELSYTSAPHIIIAGMHDNCLPERMPADSYLPHAYRAFMGLTNNNTRLARDSFLLTALLHSRPSGNIHFVLSACTTDGTPQAPSSLLLRCSTPQQTAARVERLFADATLTTTQETYDTLPFITPCAVEEQDTEMESIAQIAPGIANPFADPDCTFSPTTINSFLDCPLRFWLKNLLQISPGDALTENKSEPDSPEYGSLLHEILQDITTVYASAAPTAQADELGKEIALYGTECTARKVREQYGDSEGKLPVIISIMQRNLTKTVQEFARVHAQDLCNGWEVLLREAQLQFSLPIDENEPPILFDMRVDRVDRNNNDGRMRVIDYKSNDHSPKKTHWDKLSETAALMYEHYMLPVFTETGDKDAVYCRHSVQLPLYAEAIKQKYNLAELPESAFYNMPRKTPGVVTYSTLQGCGKNAPMTPTLHANAIQCVKEAVRLMRSGHCLYSAESLGRPLNYNNFGALSIYKDPDPRILCGLPLLAPPPSAPL